jgi:hypothetical protein
MRFGSEPEYVLEARRHLMAARKRLERQSTRAHRIKAEGRDVSAAIQLLKVLEHQERRSARYLGSVLGWHRAHPRRRFPRRIKTRLINPQTLRKQRKQRKELWNERVQHALDKQFLNAPHQKAIIVDLWNKYRSLGLPNAHFVSELSNGKRETVFQRVWEMMLARHLHALGYNPIVSDEGPDFQIEHDGKKIWIEAICPKPEGLPQHWLRGPKPGELKVHDVPHNEVLLRWTAAIKEKCEKYGDYLQKRIVSECDAYIIAVNGCQLGVFPLDRGVSQFPYALEAVYPVGPLTVPIDKATRKVGQPFYSIRSQIKTAAGAPVSTTVFLDKSNAGVSAVIGYSSVRAEAPLLPLDVVHNHFARSPLPREILGPQIEEWGTEPDGEDGINIKMLQLAKAHSVGP